MKAFRSFVLGWAFLTRIPVPEPPDWEPPDLSRSLLWFPLIGWLIGLLSGLVIVFAFIPLAGNPVGMVVGYLLLVYLKDSFHLDGLADQTDALVGASLSRDRQQILKDPSLGVMGGLAMAGVLLLHVVTLASLPEFLLIRALGIAVCLGTTAAALGLCLVPVHGGRDRLAGAMATGVDSGFAPVLLVASAIFSGLIGGVGGLLIWFLMPLIAIPSAIYLARAMDGLSGDGCGFIAMLVQTVTLVGVLVAEPVFEQYWSGLRLVW